MKNQKTYIPFDKREISYAETFPQKWKIYLIRFMEFFTGRLKLIRLIRQFERGGIVSGQSFWSSALDVMGINLQVSEESLKNIPSTGPVVIVANHPHGLVDGMILAELIGKVRTDYKILTRSLLTHVDAVKE